MSNFDLNVWENGIMGIGERSIIQGLMMPDKFILPGMDCTFDLKSSCLAKPKDKPLVKESLSHEFIMTESFLMKCPIELKATSLFFSDSPRDMKHVFLKGYLMVMSYSLAAASNLVEYRYNDITCGKVKHKSLFDEVDYIWKNIVVVDSCQFTIEEMWVLIEMCDMYPNKRFGEANIYNNLILAKDDLVIFTDKENADFGSLPTYVNHERLWNNIINIAIKMDAVDDLAEVVAGMRGLPYFLREVNQLTGADCFIVDVPLSYSVTLGLEGAFGIIGVPSGNARTDPFFDSGVRGFGLRSENESDNSLLQEWKEFRGVPFFLGMSGKLKDVAVALAGYKRPELEFSIQDAFAWVMGVTKNVPKVGLNAIGKVFKASVSNDELKFVVLAANGMQDICGDGVQDFFVCMDCRTDDITSQSQPAKYRLNS
ncbi:hypothetical protein TSUD_249090 [Trifolium subterraneum]|nr:hypothetical protein TSUD_249090 [Trifolium subterraneum]